MDLRWRKQFLGRRVHSTATIVLGNDRIIVMQHDLQGLHDNHIHVDWFSNQISNPIVFNHLSLGSSFVWTNDES